jgi:hypothetical protein
LVWPQSVQLCNDPDAGNPIIGEERYMPRLRAAHSAARADSATDLERQQLGKLATEREHAGQHLSQIA